MSIKAIFPAGVKTLSINGLHQWDYGQTLEVHDDTFPALIEIHFASAGLDEAIVRPCAVVNGVASAAIPDICLEQSSPIAIWVYGVKESSGRTLRTIVLQVTPRVRPATVASIPTKVSNKYTELIEEVNRQIGALGDGSVVVARALEADHAAEATHAGTASKAHEADIAAEAIHAGTAGTAASATRAGYAEQAGEVETADRATVLSPAHTFPNAMTAHIDSPGLYSVVYYNSSARVYYSDMIAVCNVEKHASSRCTYYEPDESGTGGYIQHMEGEDLGNYNVYILTRVAAYPAG